MTDGLLPPYGQPSGPPADDAEVLKAFARGEQAGHSPQFHVEGPTLIASWDVAVALRIGPRTVLVRLDLPPGLLPVKDLVEQALASEGMTLLDSETLLAAPVAVQVLGLRASTFDLWGSDLDDAFADLRASAQGEGWISRAGSRTSPDAPEGREEH